MIELKKAVQLVLKYTPVLGKEEIDFRHGQGRILAQDIYSPVNLPPFDRAAMDGYCLRARDTLAAEKKEVKLKVIAHLAAGKYATKEINPGEAIKIMTGAPIPRGADALIMQEYTRERGGYVFIQRPTKKQENISKKGEDVGKGELILKKGSLLGAAEMGMLAMLGKTRIKVSRRPRVAIIATGDEIVCPQARIKKGQIRNANSYTLSAAVQESGGIPELLGIAPDAARALKEKFNRAKACEIIIFSAGISEGMYDLVKEVFARIGVKTCFWKVKMKPGKPTFFGRYKKSLVFGLPGYPASSMIVFQELVRPAIMKMQSSGDIFPRRLFARIRQDLSLKPGRTKFLRAHLYFEKGGCHVLPLAEQKSGVLKSMLRANCLLIIPGEKEKIKKGELCEVEPLKLKW